MPTQRIIKSTFIGLNNEPLKNAAVQVIHMKGNTINSIEYPQVTKNFITDRNGQVDFTLWCNEEGERSSFYRFILPGGDTFDAVVPVGTSDLELSVLRNGGGNSTSPQYQSLITYILNEVGTIVNLATSSVAGKVKTNSTSTDPVVYLKSEVDNLLSDVTRFDLTDYYNKPQTDSLLNSKADQSTTYTKTQTDTLIAGATVDLSGYYTKTQTDGLVSPKANSSDVTAALLLKANSSDVNTSLATKADASSLNSHTTNTSNPHSTTAAQVGAVPITDKGIALGVATLDSGAKIPDSQIPDTITRDTELNTGLALKADVSTTYTKTQTDTLLTAKANQSTTYTKTEVDNLVSAHDTLIELNDVAINSPTNGQALTYNSSTSKWNNQTISSGEINTASNVGTGGVGVYKQKTGANLEFKNINAGSTKISINDDSANNTVDIDVAEANLTLNNLSGTLSIAKGGTGSTTASAALTALGAASSTTLSSHISNTANPHATTAAQVGAIATTAIGVANGVASLDTNSLVPDAQISSNIARTSTVNSSLALKANLANPSFTGTVTIPTPTAGDNSTNAASTAFVTTAISSKADASTLSSHTSNTSNPHNTTASQVGNTTAQWNANALQGVNINTTTPTNGQVLAYNSTSSKWEPTTSSGGGSTTLATLTDVTVTSPTNNQLLTYNTSTSKWVNQTPTFLSTTGNQTATGILTLSNTTASTSSTTGALIVSGGVGIGGQINATSIVSSGNTYVNGSLQCQTTGSTHQIAGTLNLSNTSVTHTISGKLSTSGVKSAFTTKTANYTISTSDEIIYADATTGNITLTLPSSVGIGGGFEYRIKKKDSSANTITIATALSQTIDGSSTYVLSTQYQKVYLVSDGANWLVF